MKNTITVKAEIIIHASQESVWDYSQNFDSRRDWDKSVLKCTIITRKPIKLIALKLSGGVFTKLKYKLCRRPHKTSLQMTETKSFIIKGGGGSWTYNTSNQGTVWIQQNSLILKNSLFFLLFSWFIKRQLAHSTQRSMQRAKQIIEQNNRHAIK